MSPKSGRLELIAASLKKFKLNSLFYKMFLTTFLIVAAFGVLNYITLLYATNKMLTKEISSNKILLDYNLSNLDEMMKKINNIFYSLEYDADVITIRSISQNAYEHSIDRYYREIGNIVNKLGLFKITSGEISNLYIVLSNIGKVIDQGGLNNFDAYIAKRYTASPQEIEKRLSQKHLFSIYYWDYGTNHTETISTSSLNIIKTFNDKAYKGCAIIANLDDKFLQTLFAGNKILEERKIYIIDDQRRILGCNTGEKPGTILETIPHEIGTIKNGSLVDSDGNLISYKQSSFKNIYYIILTPKSIIMKDIEAMRQISTLFLVLLFLLCFASSIFISQKFYTPIGNILGEIDAVSIVASGNGKSGHGELDLIRSNLFNALSSNQTLRNMVQKGVPLIVEVALLKIILGGDEEKEKSRAIIEQYDIDFRQGHYNIAVLKTFKEPCIHIEKTEELSVIIKRTIPSNIISLFKVKEDEYIIVLFYNMPDEEKSIFDQLQFLERELYKSNNDVGIHIGIGIPVFSIFDVHESYIRAINAICERRVQDEKRVFIYPDYHKEQRDKLSVPIDMEQRILTGITAGNSKLVEKYVREILDGNYERNISFSYYLKLCLSIQSIFTRVLSELSSSSPAIGILEGIDSENDIILLNDKLFRNINVLCEYYSKKSKTEPMLRKLISYVDENFNKDINLDIVAIKFDYSPSYVSKCFKQLKGINFNDFLNQKRVEMAKQLLATSDKSVKDIAIEAGYNNTNVFIRAFERFEGKTPGEYRKKIKFDSIDT